MERKTAIITGIAPGLGEALAIKLADAGYYVSGIARSGNAAKNITSAVQANGGIYRHVSCDVTDGPALTATIRATEETTGPAAILIHNAHRLMVKPFLETEAGAFEEVWRTVCLGAVNAAKAVLPSMLEQGSGVIILTGATASIRAGAKFSAFASAKFALRALAQSLAREFGPRGIHVAHTVLDGLIWAPQTRERFDPAQENCMAPDAITDAYLPLINQPSSAWTHELDLRPHKEGF